MSNESTLVKQIRAAWRQAVTARDGWQCWYCGCHLSVITYVTDHVIPRIQGGSDDLANLVGACAACNGRKGTKSLEEYRALLLRQSGAVFTPAQVAFWRSYNVELPSVPRCAIPVFYGEAKATTPEVV